MPYRYETRTEGARAQHLLTVETVRVNPPLDDSRFTKPSAAAAPPPGTGEGHRPAR